MCLHRSTKCTSAAVSVLTFYAQHRVEPTREDVMEMDGVEQASVEPAGPRDLVATLRSSCGMQLPSSDDEWVTFPRTSIIVRRKHVLEDALREAKKARFDPNKILNVSGRSIM